MRSRVRSQKLPWLLFLLVVWSDPLAAMGYTCGSLMTPACHEKITASALRLVRAQTSAGAPIALRDKTDRALISELPFEVDDDLRDLAAVTLLLGNRWVDFGDLLSRDMDRLAFVQEDPKVVMEHGLRGIDDDEDNDGAKRAIAATYACIQTWSGWAVTAGLDDSGLPDPDKRTVLPTYLAFSGTVNVKVPVFYLYIGQSLHTLQDTFSHTLRSPDGMRITSPMNTIEAHLASFDERVDGPRHPAATDQCENLDERREMLLQHAINASAELLLAGLDSSASASQRSTAIKQVLDKYLTYQSGCTYENRWCDAPELDYLDPRGCECQTASGGLHDGALSSALPLLLLVVLWLVARGGKGRPGAPLLLVASVWLLPGDAFAQSTDEVVEEARAAFERSSTAALPASCVPGRQLACGCPGGGIGVQLCGADGRGFGPCTSCRPPAREAPAGVEHKEATKKPASSTVEQKEARTYRWGLETTLGAALDKTAFAVSVAGRFRLHEKWHIGLGLEWNPWASFELMRVNEGAFNVYLTLVRQYPMTDRFALRTLAHFGLSALLVDLVSASAGTVGLYFRISFLGLEYRLNRRLRITLDPADVVLPFPSLKGTPLTYIQYRFSVGLLVDLY
jgi:hypothetical protein